jgi:V-type H+-transporting ATPase subunit C
MSQYNQTKGALQAAERKRTGNLATKSLVNVVNPKAIVRDSEYLDTHLIAVPNNNVKDFYKEYEELCPMVVPRSANELAQDSEFTLFAVTTFKKHSTEFVHKCREKRWTPRDYQYKEGNKEEEAKEAEQLAKDEKKLWGEALRLGRTGYSESAMIWIHVLALRVFVETVLRYGLPLDFVCGIVQVSSTYQGAHRIYTNLARPTQSQLRKQRQTSMRPTHTLAATPLAATAKVGSRRTTRLCQLIWHKLDRWATKSTRRMSTMSLRCYSMLSEQQ